MSGVIPNTIMTSNPATQTSSPPLSDDTRHPSIESWNQTTRDYPRDKCIHQLFELEAAQRPDAIALEFGCEQLTYRELNRRSDHLAAHLRSFGVKPNDLVGLSLERSLERIISLLGILKAGATYWALEENLPPERLQFLIKDAQPKLLLTRRKTAENFIGLITVLAIEELSISTAADAISIADSIRPQDPAYVSYTSGSTGQPKGVVVPHRGVVRLVKGTDYVSLSSEEILMHHSPLSFDASTFEIWGALLNGGRVVILPPAQHSLSEIGRAIRQYRITTLWLTAGLFHLMVDEELEALKNLRQLLVGGDVLCPQRVTKAHRALPDCRLINGYGPTENTTFTCCYTVNDEKALSPSVPIGRPIANTRAYILNPDLQPVTLGEIGELYTGGDGLACGYLKRPQLTAERFIPDPFSTETGARIYRTGDRVRQRSDGNLEFLGRIDNQVKIRGFRVELGEIEVALRTCPGIREAVVVWQQELPTNGTLVGYVVLTQNRHCSTAKMRRHLRQLLPDYMTPTVFIILDHLPLMANGKLDRHHLPALSNAPAALAATRHQPQDLLEFELIRIWQRLFRHQAIDRNDHFIELGGHSLLAAQLAAEIEKLVHIQLPIAAILQSPTVASLALRLTTEKWLPRWSSLVPLHPLGSKSPLFFIHGWGGDVYVFVELAKQIDADQPVYGIQAVGLDGKATRHTSVKSMAEHYIEEIRSLQPEGPYFLGAYSLGGLIALEVAQQLQDLGQSVAFLGLIDSDPVDRLPWMVYTPYIFERGWLHFRRWLDTPNRGRLNYLKQRWTTLRTRAARNSAKPAVAQAPAPPNHHQPSVAGFDDYYHALTAASQLRRYRGSVAIFASDEGESHGVAAWRHLVCGAVSLYRVPGGHFDVFKPAYVIQLAKALRTALDQTR